MKRRGRMNASSVAVNPQFATPAAADEPFRSKPFRPTSVRMQAHGPLGTRAAVDRQRQPCYIFAALALVPLALLRIFAVIMRGFKSHPGSR